MHSGGVHFTPVPSLTRHLFLLNPQPSGYASIGTLVGALSRQLADELERRGTLSRGTSTVAQRLAKSTRRIGHCGTGLIRCAGAALCKQLPISSAGVDCIGVELA